MLWKSILTVWSLLSVGVRTETVDRLLASFYISELDSAELDEPKLLRDAVREPNLTCLRLYAESRFQGSWSDICSSNELLRFDGMFNTHSVCAPKDQWWDKKRYWLLFEQPHFHGPYVILSEKDCIRHLPRVLRTVGSVLKCVQNGIIRPTIHCEFPPKPWREFRQLNELEIRAQVDSVVRRNAEIGPMTIKGVRNGDQDDPQVKFANHTLDKLQADAVEWRKQEAATSDSAV
ncbi:uncharacterized protein DEA37_0006636 [Paragonimus westermani]|uniref:Interleukin-4 inducing immunoglobulin-binding domain-containing protein n=1 Tax=Paragonimus westermani TaxID=34504 RepID=A0A5J4NI30_9TREM|nr:uncharacterized protein DEA37_0006636 [Paragonimus westermani]